MSIEYAFLIDTNKYAGNFERPMTAYITGNVGECEVGEDQANTFREETGLVPFDFVEHRVYDHHGCYRPTRIFDTPGWFNHGLGNYFKDGNEDAALIDYVACVERQGFNDAQKIEARNLKEVKKHPSFQSVGIFCSRKPTIAEIQAMKERAYKYAEINGIEILGFRLCIEERIFRFVKV